MAVTNFDTLQANAFIGPVINSSGTVYFVNSATGSNTYDGKGWETALATIDAAIGKCTANKGDVILVAPNHAETLTAAGAITADIAGISIIGLGVGSNRARITFGTSTAASILITGASTKILNIIGIAGIDGLINPFNVQAADVELDIEWRDGSASVEAARAVLTNASADRFKLNLNYLGYIAGNAVVNAVRLVGCNDGDINVNFYGVASTSIVEFHTTACSNVKVTGNFYNSGTTDLSKNVVDTVTGSTWSVAGFDSAAGCSFSGGSGAAVAKDDVSAVNTAIAALQADIGDPSSRTNLQTLQAMLGNPDVASQSIWNALAVAGGIATYPVAAVPGNGAAIAQVLRDTWDVLRNGTGGSEPGTNRSIIDEIRDYGGEGNRVSKQITLNGGTSYAAFTVTGVVAVKVIGVINTATTNHADTSSVGTATSAAGLIAATAGTAMQTVNQIWTDNAPSKFEAFPATRNVISESIALASTANIAAGVITLYCFWKPISSDGNVVAA